MRSRLMIATGAALLLLGSISSAGVYDPCGHLYTTCEGNAMHVHFYVGGATYLPQIVGYDLYRSVLGVCAPAVRLTNVPWPRVASDTEYQLIDSVITPGHKNVYRVVGVDSTRDPIELGGGVCPNNFNAHVNWDACGPAPAAHGTVEWGAYSLLVLSCDPCYPDDWYAAPWPASLEPYIGSGIPLLLYGDQGCQGWEPCGMSIDAFVEAPCTVGVTPQTWSQMRRLYK